MKKTSFLIAMLVCSLLINCDYERVGEADPTSFSGKVIFSDTGEPFNGSIAVAGYRIIFPVRRTIIDKRQELDAEGKFDFTFEGNIEIDYFGITISPPPDYELNPSSIASRSCGELDCNRVAPGKVYENLIFEVTPKE